MRCLSGSQRTNKQIQFIGGFMFLKDTDAYKRFQAEYEPIKDIIEHSGSLLRKNIHLGPEFRNKLLWQHMMVFVHDFIYWADSRQLADLMPDGKPIGFDIDSLDELEELFFHVAELQKSDGYSDEEEGHFAVKIISAFISDLMHYQFGFEYAYPKVLKDGSSWAVGIRFPSGHEFSFYAYFRRLLTQLEGLRGMEGAVEKYNGLTKDFIKVMLRVEESGDLREYALYQEWLRSLDQKCSKQAEGFHSIERELLGQSVLKQEENTDSIPMIFAYYCHDLLLDLFDGSIASYGQRLGFELPVKQFRFSEWNAIDDLVATKIHKMISEGRLTASSLSQWQTEENLRRRLSGLMNASLSVGVPLDFTMLYPTDRFSAWVLPMETHEPWRIANSDDSMMVRDDETFSSAIQHCILNGLDVNESRFAPCAEIKKAFAAAVTKLKALEKKIMPGKALDRLSLANAMTTELEHNHLPVETPEKIFSTKRSLCYAVKGEMRGQGIPAVALLKAAVGLCMEWVGKRMYFPVGHAENPLDTFDVEKYVEDGYPSFSFNAACTAEVFSFMDQNKWFLRLYEPDNGVYLSDEEFIPGEPGRFVENHIAFWLEGQKLMSAFSTYTLHSYRSESRYRGSCASLIDLFRKKGFALRNGGVFDARPLICQTFGDISSITSSMNLSREDIPAVVCAYHEAAEIIRQMRKKPGNAGPVTQKAGRGLAAAKNWDPSMDEMQESQAREEAFEVYKNQLLSILLLIKRCAYKVRIIMLPESLLERFCAKSGLNVTGNAVSLFFGKGEEALLTLTMEDFIASPDKGIDLIQDSVLDVLDGNESFSTGFDYYQALEIAAAAKSTQVAENEQWQAYHNSKVQLMAETHAREIESVKNALGKVQTRQRVEIEALEKKLKGVMKRQTEETATTAALEALSKKIAVLEGVLEEKNLRLEYMESTLTRPQRFEDLDEWISNRFSDEIILLPRALRELKAIQPKAYNLPLLCDCLEYLACEYSALLRGRLSQEEVNKRCSIKYGRLFSVTPNKGGIKGEYSEQYQVNWQGKTRNLDLHLGVGNTAPFLIRIYFFFDTEEKRIFVGSLPGHLDT